MHTVDFRVQTFANTARSHTDDQAVLQITFDPLKPMPNCHQVGTTSHFVVSSDWRGVMAQFGPFKLTQYFVQQLQNVRLGRVLIEELNGATADLARMAYALGIPTVIENEFSTAEDADSLRWSTALRQSISQQSHTQDLSLKFGYETYALGMRNHALLAQMQAPHASHFAGCARVLDVGCGTGVFLDLLTRQGITAEGVERNAQSVRFALSLGLTIHTDDALEFLARHPNHYDGLYCSHFVEHLPIDAVERLIQLCAQALQPGGIAVFTFPDPESIRSQLLGFWRDPEHVRFYRPELIETLAQMHGLLPEFNSQQIPGRTVGSFSLQPPSATPGPCAPASLWARWAKALGLATAADLAALQAHNQHQQHLIEQLWQVNQTWAWEDNVVLRLRKPLA
jgi:O-antigen chain-terminating methyltransferase